MSNDRTCVATAAATTASVMTQSGNHTQLVVGDTLCCEVGDTQFEMGGTATTGRTMAGGAMKQTGSTDTVSVRCDERTSVVQRGPTTCGVFLLVLHQPTSHIRTHAHY